MRVFFLLHLHVLLVDLILVISFVALVGRETGVIDVGIILAHLQPKIIVGWPVCVELFEGIYIELLVGVCHILSSVNGRVLLHLRL